MYIADKNSTVKALCLFFLEEKAKQRKGKTGTLLPNLYEKHY